MTRILLEVCVDCPESLRAAIAGGADRIELCSALEIGGLTPSLGFMRLAGTMPVQVHALIRPRSGGFEFDADELGQMVEDIRAAREAGLAGVVIGALRGGVLDLETLMRLKAAAGPMSCTLHRAFDLCADPFAALDQSVAIGLDRILTSGQAVTAMEGAALLGRLFGHADGRIGILPAAGITDRSVAALSSLPLTEVHASCSVLGPTAPLGFGAARVTTVARVRALKAALVDLGRHSS
ncbi:copper homeostasis protein CutC [Tabrizicola sp. J26]|uniref:copper homeostasis protein CutC n=1 Tax=Alitabrizicola rongguiensis TaxID=2909234 RepID=UPI001F2DEB1B|nr:copper homeostasis protein CutC [Tabrizicola rongguiensis]MCF1708347.1 copper homeostasis protein CutC [Tabrizicola rongguiensis]